MEKNLVNRILVVEDEQDIGEILGYQIKQMGHEVDHVRTGEEALTYMNRKDYDMILLDWMLPWLSGVEIAQIVRKMENMKHVAILMLTAKSDADNIVEGLEAGADDYMTKPFNNEILKARVTSLLRRVNRGKGLIQEVQPVREEADSMEIGPLKVSLKTYKAFLDNKELSLTPSEFKLLTTMVTQRGRVLTRSRLIEEVQGEGISVIGRTIDTHVFGLRKKLGDFSNMIETVRGVGYRVRDDLI